MCRPTISKAKYRLFIQFVQFKYEWSSMYTHIVYTLYNLIALPLQTTLFRNAFYLIHSLHCLRVLFLVEIAGHYKLNGIIFTWIWFSYLHLAVHVWAYIVKVIQKFSGLYRRTWLHNVSGPGVPTDVVICGRHYCAWVEVTQSCLQRQCCCNV